MAYAYPAGGPQGNTYVPSFEASGELVVSFSRNPKDFALNSYVTLTPTEKSTGYFLRISPDNAMRILSTTGADTTWADGNDAPTGTWNTEAFEFAPFLTKRHAYPFRLGYKAVEQAVWKILAAHAAMAAQQAMTDRTIEVNALLDATGNYPTGHYATATAQGGGFLSDGTAANPIILRALNACAFKIQKDTGGIVRPRDLVLVVNPELANAMAASQEIHTYLAQSPAALAQVRGDVPSQNGLWGLPDTVYGYRVAIEDAVKVAQLKGATADPGYIKDDNTAWLVARPGQLVGTEGAPSFSTAHIFVYEEMTVESKDDPDNRRHQGRVVDDRGAVMISGLSGFLITNTLS